MQKFIEEFRQTPYYAALIAPENVIAIFVAGSRACGTNDERSDYDLQILTADDNDEFDDVGKRCYLRWNGVYVHWYITSISLWAKPGHYTLTLYGALNAIMLARPEAVIYENPKYPDALSLLRNYVAEIYDAAVYSFYRWAEEYINDILSAGEIPERLYSKKIYHLCLSSYLLTGDEPDVEFLRKIKRIRWQPVSDEHKQLAIRRLQKLKDNVVGVLE